MENERYVKYHWRKVGDDIYIYIFNKFNPKNNLKESMEPENSYQKMTTKYPAPKKEIVIVMWDMR